MFVMLSVFNDHYAMGRRRCFARFWTSKRRKAAAFSAGEWRRWMQSQEERDQCVCTLSDEEQRVFVDHWPSSVQWPYGRQPVATCQTETEALLEL